MCVLVRQCLCDWGREIYYKMCVNVRVCVGETLLGGDMWCTLARPRKSYNFTIFYAGAKTGVQVHASHISKCVLCACGCGKNPRTQFDKIGRVLWSCSGFECYAMKSEKFSAISCLF